MDKVAGSGNDEYYTPPSAVMPIIKHLPSPSRAQPYTIWCPFDTEESHFVKLLRERGYKVIATHISTGADFFKIPTPECDCIISNPPYSRKGDVLQRLFDIDKPFAMLVGVVGLFESKKRFEMFRRNKFEILYLSKRVKYMRDYNDQKPEVHPPYSSVYVCHNLLEKTIMFEEL